MCLFRFSAQLLSFLWRVYGTEKSRREQPATAFPAKPSISCTSKLLQSPWNEAKDLDALLLVLLSRYRSLVQGGQEICPCHRELVQQSIPISSS